MPFEKFDRSKLKIKPLAERVHDIDLSIMIDPKNKITLVENPKYDILAKKIKAARESKSTVLLMYGGHVVRSGCGPYLIEMMKEKLITHCATNGAGAIHDFELAMIGATCESVAKYIAQGQFGLWKETGIINEILKQGEKEGVGAGEAIGKYIWENNFPNKESSILAMGYHLQVPCTVHIGIGNDIIHEHENCSGAALGATSYTDFLIYTQSITKLQGGVFLNFGSAVTGPEVYLKALSMARNEAHQKNEEITDFTTAVFDLMPMDHEDFQEAPKKTDPRYYFRPWKTILARTVADGGCSFYISGEHKTTIPNLCQRALG